jgi:hypothetical protein
MPNVNYDSCIKNRFENNDKSKMLRPKIYILKGGGVIPLVEKLKDGLLKGQR